LLETIQQIVFVQVRNESFPSSWLRDFQKRASPVLMVAAWARVVFLLEYPGAFGRAGPAF
jgi:hypothetical protein